jgi:hypothetical protein
VIDWELVQKLAPFSARRRRSPRRMGVSVDTLHRHAEFAGSINGDLKGAKRACAGCSLRAPRKAT